MALKEREQKILDYMKEEIREKGYPPTVREICAALGIKSTSTAHKDIAKLEKRVTSTTDRLKAQYQTLESLLGQYQKTGDFMTQQIASWQSTKS